MWYRSLKIAVLALSVAMASRTVAQEFGPGFVFSIHQGGRVVGYLGGSIHLLRQTDLPLPVAFQHALANSGEIVFETDLSTASDREFQRSVVRNSRLPEGQQLSDLITAETQELLKKHLAKTELSLDVVSSRQPWMAAMMIARLQLQNLGYDHNSGVDYLIFSEATDEGRKISWLENPLQQIEILSEIGREHPDELIANLLAQLPDSEVMIADIVQAWKTGNVELIEKYVLLQFPENSVAREKLLTQRNRAWTPLMIEKMNTSQKPPFFVVGAGHLLGENSLLQFLMSSGYTIVAIKD